ncbi:hypothetical protein [Kosakonia cowanii]|uniref:hypothetical protein n=1 Tax=Kosakonia cowanii TaxID=208223 RepID=UPI0029E1E89B|nr:hypothetical protein [Kosakonia cowanii]
MTDEELTRLVHDKSDYRKRLDLIARLQQEQSARSTEALVTLAKEDFVFAVRHAAWEALSERGVALKEPRLRSRFADWLERVLHRIGRFFSVITDYWWFWHW